MTSLESRIMRNPALSWQTRILSFSLGILVIIFFGIISGAIDQSTEIVDLSNTLVIVFRIAAVGLGTGHYLGISLQQEESGERWFLFGAFTTLSVITFFTVDLLIYNRVPAAALLLISGAMPIIAHFNPAIKDNDEYINIVRLLGGYISTLTVVFISVSEYVFTLINATAVWFNSLSLMPQIAVIILFLGVIYIIHGGVISLREKELKREVKRKRQQQIADEITKIKKEELQRQVDNDERDTLKRMFSSVGVDLEDVIEEEEDDS